MKQRWPILLLAVVIATATATLWSLRDADAPLDRVGAVTIAASLTVSPSPIWVALDQGFFDGAGLDATVKQFSSGKTTTEAMLRGEVDLSASAEFLAVRKSFDHKELRILGTLAFVHQIKLLGLRERGIERITDFKGKRVGVRLGTNGEYFLARLLTLNGMQREDIEWVDTPPQAKADAMAAGEVDGVLTWPPFVQQIQSRLGERVVVFDGQPGQDYYYVLLGREEWVAAHPLVAERVMLALNKAVQWLHANPAQGKAYLAGKFGVTEEEMADILAGYRFAISLPQTLLTALEAETRWLEGKGGTAGPRVENFIELIEFGPLQRGSPAKVTIIR